MPFKCSECSNEKEFAVADFFVQRIASASSFGAKLPSTVQPISCAKCGLVLNDRDFKKPRNEKTTITGIIKHAAELKMPKEKIIKIRTWISVNMKQFMKLNLQYNEKTLLNLIMANIEEKK